jgi:hypothetical protein
VDLLLRGSDGDGGAGDVVCIRIMDDVRMIAAEDGTSSSSSRPPPSSVTVTSVTSSSRGGDDDTVLGVSVVVRVRVLTKNDTGVLRRVVPDAAVAVLMLLLLFGDEDNDDDDLLLMDAIAIAGDTVGTTVGTGAVLAPDVAV